MTARLPLAVVLALLLSISWVIPQAKLEAKTIAFFIEASNNSLKHNEEMVIQIKGRDLADMYAYEAVLDYDTHRLKLVKATSSIKGFTVEPIVKEGRITFAHTMTGGGSGYTGDAILASLTFKSVNPGEAFIALRQVKLVDSTLRMASHTVEEGVSIVITGGEMKDIAGHWAEAYIQEALLNGIVSGYENGMFQPQRLVTRAEFTAMIVRLLDLPLEADLQYRFTDHKEIPSWALPFVSSAVSAGVVTGYEDKTFRADHPITRAEMVTMLVKAMGLNTESASGASFADEDLIAQWAQPYVAAAAQRGLIHGRGNNLFAPEAHATRAEAVKLIMASGSTDRFVRDKVSS